MGRPLVLALAVVLSAALGALVISGPDRCGPHTGCGSPQDAARLRLWWLATAIDLYRRDHRALPPSLETLTRSSRSEPVPYLERIPKDPWGNAFEYRPGEGQAFRLRCLGEDRRPGTLDDLAWPEPGEGASGGARPPASGEGPHPDGR